MRLSLEDGHRKVMPSEIIEKIEPLVPMATNSVPLDLKTEGIPPS